MFAGVAMSIRVTRDFPHGETICLEVTRIIGAC